MPPIPKEKGAAGSRSSAKANYVPKFALARYIKCVPGVRSYWQKNFPSQSLTLLIFVIDQYAEKLVREGVWVYFDPWYNQLIRHDTH